MKIILPQEVEKILEKMQTAGYEIYVVGGAIRDLLLGKIVNDWDFTTNATPEQTLEIFPEGYYNNKYGMVGVPASTDDLDPFEITTYRTEEGYSDNRRPDSVSWGKSLEEDLSRRDFTINAIALSFEDNKLAFIDPYDGRKDLDNKIIKAVGDPDARFNEDALRLMRAVRIAAELRFSIEVKTLAALKTNAHLIQKISKERIREEFLRLLSAPNPDEAILLLKEAGLLKEILPELEVAFKVEQKSPSRHHIYDVGTHSVMSLKFCKSEDPITRLATLIHDLGKPQTYKKLETGVVTFYNHEVIGARIAKQVAQRLKLSNKEAEKLWLLVRWHQFTVNEDQTDTAIRRFIRHVKIENVDDMLALRVGDRLGGGARETSWRLEEFKKRIVEVQKQPFAVKDLKIKGTDVMELLNIPPSPKVGEILNAIFKKVENKELENDKEVLKEEVKKLA